MAPNAGVVTAAAFGISPDQEFAHGNKAALVSLLDSIPSEFYDSNDMLFQAIVDRA